MTTPSARFRVLVVDDELDSRALVVALLERMGYGVTTAPDGTRAIAMANDRPPDLVILDVMMPGMDGFETCRALKKLHGDGLPVLMLSGRGRQSVIEGLGAGADDYLPKPFDLDEFRARVQALLRIRSAEHAARQRADRLLGLQRVSAAVAGQLNERELLPLVLGEVVRLLSGDVAVYYEWDDARGLLKPANRTGQTGLFVPTPRKLGEGLVGACMARGEAIVVNDYASWDNAVEYTRSQGVRAAVGAPLVLGDLRLGVIGVYRLTGSTGFDEEDAQILALLALQAAVAINNARLYASQQAAARLEAARAAQIETIMQSIGRGVILVDADGHITSANRAASRIFHQPVSSILGKRAEQIVPVMKSIEGVPIPDAERPAALALRTGNDQPEREIVAEIDGDDRILVITTNLIRDPGGAVTGAASVIGDVTDARRAEERRVQADKLRALGQLASGVAHDVNNLLASVLGRAELARLELERGGMDPRRISEALRVIEQAAEDGAQTVRRIQEFGRVREHSPPEPVDVLAVARDAIDLTRSEWRDKANASGRSIETSLDVEPNLFVSATAAELREVLTNLIINAVDAMPGGGRIAISAQRMDEMVRISVADTGVGMAASIRRRALDPFFTTKGEGGTGLGLAVSYGIVQRYGGQLSIETAPGQGTTVIVELPVSAQEPPAELPPPVPRDVKRHILVVDDEPALASVLQRLLESEGHSVVACTSGTEALARFDPSVHELVMTDLGMQDLNGLQVAAAVRLRSPNTPVILVTGWGNELDPDHPPRGISRVLPKPYRLAKVLEAVDSVLSGAVAAG
ncbi:MAG: response regulator [Chloroflexota bacterium]